MQENFHKKVLIPVSCTVGLATNLDQEEGKGDRGGRRVSRGEAWTGRPGRRETGPHLLANITNAFPSAPAERVAKAQPPSFSRSRNPC